MSMVGSSSTLATAGESHSSQWYLLRQACVDVRLASIVHGRQASRQELAPSGAGGSGNGGGPTSLALAASRATSRSPCAQHRSSLSRCGSSMVNVPSAAAAHAAFAAPKDRPLARRCPGPGGVHSPPGRRREAAAARRPCPKPSVPYDWPGWARRRLLPEADAACVRNSSPQQEIRPLMRHPALASWQVPLPHTSPGSRAARGAEGVRAGLRTYLYTSSRTTRMCVCGCEGSSTVKK